MKIDLSKKQLTTCCSMTNGLIVKKTSKILYLGTQLQIYNTSWKRETIIFFHKISDVLPFTKGIVKLQ